MAYNGNDELLLQVLEAIFYFCHPGIQYRAALQTDLELTPKKIAEDSIIPDATEAVADLQYLLETNAEKAEQKIKAQRKAEKEENEEKQKN